MIAKAERKQIIALINREVVPAIGCTEPIAVALCVARATEALGCKPERIKALLSANILKNAMGVGIPGTGMIGLPIAIALGALIGKSEYQLEVLKDSTPEAVEEGKKLIDAQAIDIALKIGIEEKLYIEIICEAQGKKATAIISGGHTHFVYVANDEEILLNKQAVASSNISTEDIQLTLKKVYDFAMTAPLEEIDLGTSVRISAVTGEGIEKLLRAIEENLPVRVKKVQILVPFSQAGLVAEIRKGATLLSEEYTAEGILAEAIIDGKFWHRVRDYVVE